MRALFGGNRSGKTEAAVVEMIWHLLGDHPYQQVTKPPVYWRVVVVDYTELEKVVNSKLRALLPKSALIGGDWKRSYNERTHILTLANGSQVDMMTHEQPILAFEGASRDGTLFDEEPPEDVYTACVLRHVDRRGKTIIAATPLSGISWLYDKIYLPSFGKNRNIESFTISIYENKFLDMEAIREIESLITDEIDREIRLYGKFRSRSGLVFKDFDPDVHVYREEHLERLRDWWDGDYPPSYWPHIVGIDPGWEHPAAAVWLAVDPNTGERWFYRSFKQSNIYPDEHAEIIHEYNAQMGIENPIYVIDSQAKAVTGRADRSTIWQDYADAGIVARLGTKKLFEGNMRLARLMRVERDKYGNPHTMFHVSWEAEDLIDELGKYQRAKPTPTSDAERFIDKNNDAIAAARYANWEAERVDWYAWMTRNSRLVEKSDEQKRGFKHTGY